MMFKQTNLWKSAFEKARQDATAEEQARLSACYLAMRERASALVLRIKIDLPQMTIHDVTHLDALWEMAEIACGSSLTLNPAEAFVFGGAVLFHDAAMSLAAFSGGVAELRKTSEWRDLQARYSEGISAENDTAVADAEKRATEDALRILHASRAESLPKISWDGPQGQRMFAIEDQQIRSFYGPKIGKIAYSHWWPIAKVEEEFASPLGALPSVTSCTVDLLKVACLLRVADAMHLDQRRAPAFEFALTQPTGIASNHWRFQERMAKPYVQGDALVYTAQPPFEVEFADAWWTAFDALKLVDQELRNVDRVLRDRQKSHLLVRRVEGVHTPGDLSRIIETSGWTPVDSAIKVTDVPKIVSTLGGQKLYGESNIAPIRELIQNGLDAIIARRRLQARPNKWGELQVKLEKRDSGYWLCVEDNGVGMSTTVLTGPLIDFGNSFWKSSLAIAEFPGLLSSGMKVRGKYGIGFFSVFMLGDHVRVVTRRYDQDARSAKVLEFVNGLTSRPNLLEADLSEVPLDGGTRIEVKLRNDPKQAKGLLHKKDFFGGEVISFAKLVTSIAPAPDVNIKVIEDDAVVNTIIAGDWLEIESGVLLGRLSDNKHSLEKIKYPLPLRELRDEDGRIFGRACIDPTQRWSSFGLIAVDGLTASRAPLISGILLGLETTASRNSAKPTVPAPVLAAWASEQAIAISEADLSDSDKADAAAIIMACGGNIADLPIVLWKEEWLSSTHLAAALGEVTRFVLHVGEVKYDDNDEVRKRDFESEFEADQDIAWAVERVDVLVADWITSVVQGKGNTPVDAIEEALANAWGEVHTAKSMLVVGEVNGTDIYRLVTVYTRAGDDEQEVED